LKAIVSLVTPLPDGYYVLKLAVEFEPDFFQPYKQMFQLRNPVMPGEELEVEWADRTDPKKGLVIIRR
jgi:hypothetical protein